MEKKNFSLFESILIGLACFGIGGLTALIVNTVQVSKINKPSKYTVKATFEPERMNETKGN